MRTYVKLTSIAKELDLLPETIMIYFSNFPLERLYAANADLRYCVVDETRGPLRIWVQNPDASLYYWKLDIRSMNKIFMWWKLAPQSTKSRILHHNESIARQKEKIGQQVFAMLGRYPTISELTRARLGLYINKRIEFYGTIVFLKMVGDKIQITLRYVREQESIKNLLCDHITIQVSNRLKNYIASVDYSEMVTLQATGIVREYTSAKDGDARKFAFNNVSVIALHTSTGAHYLQSRPKIHTTPVTRTNFYANFSYDPRKDALASRTSVRKGR